MSSRIRGTFVATIMLAVIATCERASAMTDGVDVDSGHAASAVVNLWHVGCTGVIVSPSWVLTAAHCASPSRSRGFCDNLADRKDPELRDLFLTEVVQLVPFLYPTVTPACDVKSYANARGCILPDGERDKPCDYEACSNMSEEQCVCDSKHCVRLDRVVLVDGEDTGTNSVALFHMVHPAPPWVQPIPLYRGESYEPDLRLGETVELWGARKGKRRMGRVKFTGMDWRGEEGENQYWALDLEAAPSAAQRGDSGGPVLVTRRGRKGVAGTSIKSGRAASTFNYKADGHDKPTAFLIDRLIHEPMGHGADTLDIDGDGISELLFYDASSGRVQLVGKRPTSERGKPDFRTLLLEQLVPGFQHVEVGDFDGDGTKSEFVLINGGTGEIRAYVIETIEGELLIVPWKRYTILANPILDNNEEPVSIAATATTSGDYDADGTTELALIDRLTTSIHVLDIATGKYLGIASHDVLGRAQVVTSGMFGTGEARSVLPPATDEARLASRHADGIALGVNNQPEGVFYIEFLDPFNLRDGAIGFNVREQIKKLWVKGSVSQMVRLRVGIEIKGLAGKNVDGGHAEDGLFLYRAIHSKPPEWRATLYSGLGEADDLEVAFDDVMHSRINMIVPGNFDDDQQEDIGLFRRARTLDTMGLTLHKVSNGELTYIGRTYNWVSRWATHLQ